MRNLGSNGRGVRTWEMGTGRGEGCSWSTGFLEKASHRLRKEY